jgi:UDP-N-acetylglucosamine 2-epimerase (non-hydrolysing)
VFRACSAHTLGEAWVGEVANVGHGGALAALRLRTAEPRPVVLVVAGTRPECIKLVPAIRELRRTHALSAIVIGSGQHPEAVRRTFGEFGIRPDHELPPLGGMPNLRTAAWQLISNLVEAMHECRPDLVIVQGDTLSAYAGARAAGRVHCAVAHVEAGLRTPDVADPFPEEWFRRRIASYADYHFAPSASAHANLLAEGVAEGRIHDVGNTGIDTLVAHLRDRDAHRGSHRGPRSTVLVTLHRRENWDGKADVVCDALIALVDARPDLGIVLPVHPNPRVATRLKRRLGGRPRIALVAPMGYREFIDAAEAAALMISDSGGVQEEVPHLGTPLLVPRSCTERPEAIDTGFVQLVPVDRDAILGAALEALAVPRKPPLPFDSNAPYGDGCAANRIVRVLEASLSVREAA